LQNNRFGNKKQKKPKKLEGLCSIQLSENKLKMYYQLQNEDKEKVKIY